MSPCDRSIDPVPKQLNAHDTPFSTASSRRIKHSYIRIISRETGEPRCWGCDHADRRTCTALIADNVQLERTILYTDAWQSDHGSHPAQATVCHGIYEWARDDDGEGRRAVHGHGVCCHSRLTVL